MDQLIIYSLKVSIGIVLFYGLYLLFFQKDTFFGLRRVFFLFAMLFSMVFPFVELQLKSVEPEPLIYEPVAFWLTNMEQVIMPEADTNLLSHSWGLLHLLAAVSLTGSFFLLIRFLIQLASIIKLKKANKAEKYGDYTVVILDNQKSQSFSFFKWIFVSKNIRKNMNIHRIFEGNDFRENLPNKWILLHEKVHADQWHSVDVLLTEIFCIFLWWNPVCRLIKREIKLNLEYLADTEVVDSESNMCDYQYTLLKISAECTGIPIINNFNVSQLKKRIMMINKKKTPFGISTKYLLVVPLAGLLAIGNAVQAAPESGLFAVSEIMESLGINEGEHEKKSDSHKAVVVSPLVNVDKVPEFPGGSPALMDFVSKNLKYPEAAIKDSIEGRVMVRFVVAEDGTVTDPEIQRGLSPETDAEVLRLIKAMPKWEPGVHKGESVSVYFTLPIIYKLHR